ncbi:MAG: rubrerythrin [Thermoprotei archaeon]|nr:MAG: rubrerythrin [Thermoprotei archaeon]
MLSRNPLDIHPQKLDKEGTAQALRLAIIGELDAINLYLQLANAIEDEKIKHTLREIAKEEKIHVGELLEILKQIDPEQAKALEKGREEVKELTR